MDRFVHVGKGNVVNADEVMCVLNPRSADCKRRCRAAEKDGTIVRVNLQRKIRSVMLMKNGTIMPCILSYEALMNRLNGKYMVGKVEPDEALTAEDEEKDEDEG